MSILSSANVRYVMIIYKIAETVQERELAFRFAYNEYFNHGYIDAEKFPSKIMKDCFDSRPDSWTLIAIDDHSILGTIRMVRNCPSFSYGLPLERSFNLSALPERGEKLGEVCRFACFNRKLVAYYLMKAVIKLAQHVGTTHFVISCSALKAHHYIDRFSFKQVGEPYYYEGIVCEHQSVTLFANIEKIISDAPIVNPLFARIFRKKDRNLLIPP